MRAVGRGLWIVVAVALLLTGLLVFLSGRKGTPSVAVADVGRQNLSQIVSSNGTVEPVAPATFHAGFSSFVTKLYVVEGQRVKRGQNLYDLDDTDPRAQLAATRADLAAQQEALRVAKAGGHAGQVAQATADLQKAQASWEQLHRDNESLTKLVAEKAATQEELEQNRLKLTQAEADVRSLKQVKATLESQSQTDQGRIELLVERAQAQIRNLESQVSSAHGVAPMDGTLYSMPIHLGDFITGGALLARLADLRHVRVRAFIDEADLGQLDVNQPVEVFWDAHPDQIWHGKTEILPKQVVTRGTRNVGELVCSVSNEKLDLLPNVSVDVRIHIGERQNVLVVPRGAVYFDGNKRFVFRVENNILHRQEVKVGIANPTMIEVLSGLNEGDAVALPGEMPLKEDLRIRAVRPE